jgi:transcriptional regulator with XRE-family HTH domain
MAMQFKDRLVHFRKQKGLTQQALSDLTGIHLTQIRRYEAGSTLPTFDILRKLAVALTVSGDQLLFDEDERGPSDDFRLLFESASRLDAPNRKLLKELIESVVLKYEIRRLSAAHFAESDHPFRSFRSPLREGVRQRRAGHLFPGVITSS